METLKFILVVIGILTLLWFLAYVIGGLVESVRSGQLKRNRVHDDLNRHEREIKSQRLSLEIAHDSLKNVWEEIEKLNEDREVVNPLVEEEIPEAITISEVPVSADGYKYFLDNEGEIWRFKDGEPGNHLFFKNDGWLPGNASFGEACEEFNFISLTDQQARGLTE